MKKKITIRMGFLIGIALILFLGINYMLQAFAAQRDMVRSSRELFKQIQNVIRQNEDELGVVTEEISNICLLRARAVAYMLQQDKSKITDVDELNKIAELLEVDEIHIFNKEGILYAGSVPKYFGLTMDSGEQVGYFARMLEDTSMELCQDITANTAEAKLMQYAAVWMEDGSDIVQIGLGPERVLEQTKKNEISYIFSLFADDNGSVLLAIDPETNTVVGATDVDFLEKGIYELGIDINKMRQWDKGFHCDVDGMSVYCVFEQTDSVIIGRIYETAELYRNVNSGNIRLFFYMLIIFVVVIYSITHYLDKNVLQSITDINDKLEKIANGNLDERVEVNNTREFAELSTHINDVVESILETTDKLSKGLEASRLSIGIYEYSSGMSRVRVTSRVQEILGLDDREAEYLCSEYSLFEKWMEKLFCEPLDGESGIYVLHHGEEERYIKVETIVKGNNVFGIMIDRTKDIREKQALEHELGQDVLTGLYSRRAFYGRLDKLFVQPEKLKCGMIVMIDSDDLKKANDTYGHENGDRYLCGVADTLSRLKAPEQITARLGGDEFAIYFGGVETPEEAEYYLERLRNLRKQAVVEFTDGSMMPIRFSAGTGVFPAEGTDWRKLLKLADERMYQEKQQRKKKRV